MLAASWILPSEQGCGRPRPLAVGEYSLSDAVQFACGGLANSPHHSLCVIRVIMMFIDLNHTL